MRCTSVFETNLLEENFESKILQVRKINKVRFESYLLLFEKY